MKKSRRIEQVLHYLEPDERVADIGCDHGYVLIHGALEGKISKGIGVEVNQGPYLQALENIEAFGVEEQIELRLGNGLQPIAPGEADVCVIGGMGGRLIRQILENNPATTSSFRKLILQPMNGEVKLRSWLLDNGWKLVREEILVMDELYLYLVAEQGEMILNDPFLLEIGPLLALTPSIEQQEYIRANLSKLNHILTSIGLGNVLDEKRLIEIQDKISKWKEYLDGN